jgi:hypothetical protein
LPHKRASLADLSFHGVVPSALTRAQNWTISSSVQGWQRLDHCRCCRFLSRFLCRLYGSAAAPAAAAPAPAPAPAAVAVVAAVGAPSSSLLVPSTESAPPAADPTVTCSLSTLEERPCEDQCAAASNFDAHWRSASSSSGDGVSTVVGTQARSTPTAAPSPRGRRRWRWR